MKRQQIKIKAKSSFRSQDEEYLSFENGQQFWVLQRDFHNHRYFVSTQASTPFGKWAISGFVPIDYFVISD